MRQNTVIGGIINPLHLTPVLWIDFSDSTTVTLNGSTISQVNDKSASGLNFTQGVALNQPSYQSAVQNGLNVARFDGSTDIMTRGASNMLRNVSGATIYGVYKWAASPTTTRGVFVIRTAPANLSNQVRASLHGGLVPNKADLIARTLDADGASTAPSTANVASVFFIHTGVYDYANTDLLQYLNASQDGSDTTFGTATITSNTNSLLASIGSNVTNSGAAIQLANVDIGEILVFHAAHDAATRERVWDYLRTKWAI